MLTQAIQTAIEYKRLLAAAQKEHASVALFGLPPSARAAVLCALAADTGKTVLAVTPGEAEATRLCEDAEALGLPAAVYPARDFVMRGIEAASREFEYRRIEVLGRLVGGRVRLVAAPIEAVLQRTAPKADFLAATRTLRPGDALPQKELLALLLAGGYTRRGQIDGPGQFSVRGGIVDVFPPDMDAPARIEYWGDEVDSIHSFDYVSQRRDAKLSKLHLSPAREMLLGDPAAAAALLRGALENAGKGRGKPTKAALQKAMEADLAALDAGVSPEGMDKYLPLRYPNPAGVLDYMDAPLLFFDEPGAIREEAAAAAFRTDSEITALLEEGVLPPGLSGWTLPFPELLRQAQRHPAIWAENFTRSLPDVHLTDTLSFTAHALPPWPGDVAGLTEELRPLLAGGYSAAVLVGTRRAAKALARDLEASGIRAAEAGAKTGVKAGEALRNRAAGPRAASLAPSGQFTSSAASNVANSSQGCTPQGAEGSCPVCSESTAEELGVATPGLVTVAAGRLSAGADFPSAHFAIFTARRAADGEIKRPKAKKKGLASLDDIRPGDYVVHQNHGIGVYAGIQRLDLQGVVKDYLKISYSGADQLYVPVTQLDLLSRYTAPGDGERVKLAKLGGGEWAKTKARVRVATSEMAKDLIELYAKREEAKGTAFPPDGDWQSDFETRFEYDETPDQLVAAAEIKGDMEKARPMDRLLSGDVGVGKTEVALRAAFKCVMGGKQCAILVPTTILAWQHYNTILSRMEAFPVQVEMLSRFRTAKETRKALEGMAAGTVDIVVGTHRLLQKDIKFRDLGLLIVDEEQRFGVRHKEKLKEKFLGVDALTLSATPIPRTLNMALSGIRDMSSIEEPPTERRPVETYVMEYDEGLLASAIKKELARAGQVYYLHNRIDSIETTAAKLGRLAPGARIATAHGRMDEEALSRTWQQLLDGEIDVLVCTTLIETGVDVRNCNTLIIEDADRMGLAQLYQIRGRVGRSGRKAYAYFTFRRDKVLTDVAAKRLSAIREFTAFGSGFRIAMRDLQIRGAGNLLGQSQSGHMEAVGYDLYVKMLGQAVSLAKGEAPLPDKTNSLIDITVDAYIPDSYIPDTEGRIEAYKKIAAIESNEAAAALREELRDRYGEPPKSAGGLIDISLARVVAAKLGIYEVNQQRDTLLFYSDTLDFAAIGPALKSVKAMLNPRPKPYIAVRIGPNELPLDVLNRVIAALWAAAGEGGPSG